MNTPLSFNSMIQRLVSLNSITDVEYEKLKKEIVTCVMNNALFLEIFDQLQFQIYPSEEFEARCKGIASACRCHYDQQLSITGSGDLDLHLIAKTSDKIRKNIMAKVVFTGFEDRSLFYLIREACWQSFGPNTHVSPLDWNIMAFDESKGFLLAIQR